jgi:predicted nucleic acid-binding protein
VETLFRQAAAPFAKLPATKAVADCYLVAFAEASGAHLVTFDPGLAGTARLRQVPVTPLEPV